MRLLTILCCFMLSIMVSKAQDVTVLIKEADRLEAIPSEKAALNAFKEVLRVSPTNMYALTKASELCSRVGKREPDKDIEKGYYEAARIYAGTALRIDPASADANVEMAIAIGRVALMKSGRDRINAVKDIKRYADLALQKDPSNFKAWHILGKWYYEVSNLNIFERAATKLFYGGLPSATLQQSIDAYEKARQLNATFLLNYLELAKAYHRDDNNTKAIALLDTMFTLHEQTEDDPLIKAEGRKLLASWQ